jgi:O-antigen ligase
MLTLSLGVALLVRILTDDVSSPSSRHSGSLNLSGVIAALFILLSAGLFFRRRTGVRPTAWAVVWLCVWTAVAVSTRGASALTVREGVREASVVALAVIVFNSVGTWTVPLVTRLVQFLGLVPALLALYQLATNTGVDLGGQVRSNGTFAHPDSAAMFFALAAAVSLWRYLDAGRRASDAALVALFSVALITTFSIDGVLTLVAMLVVFGALRPGSLRAKCGPYVIAGLIAVVFFATPLGAARIGQEESTTNIAVAEGGNASSSLAWRLVKWKMLLSEWESSPLLGQGLGTTLTDVSYPENGYARKPPHNEYVRYLTETGIVGVAILLWGIVIVARDLWSRYIAGRRGAGTPHAATLAIVVAVGCLVNSLADNTILDSTTAYAAVMILATVLSLPRTTHR